MDQRALLGGMAVFGRSRTSPCHLETWPAGMQKLMKFYTCALAAALIIQSIGSALAAQTAEIKMPLSGDLVPAPFGYEPISGNYAVAHSTAVYISPYI